MKSKLILMSVVIALIPLLIISGIAYSTAKGELESAALKSNTIFARITKEQLNEYFGRIESDGQVLATSESVIDNIKVFNKKVPSNADKTLAKRAFDAYLMNAHDAYEYTAIYLTNLRGEVAYSTGLQETLIGADLSSRDYINSGLDGEQKWSPIFFSDVVNTNVMAISTPIAENGKVYGTLNILFDQRKLDSIIHDGVEELGQTGDSYLVDVTGLLLTDTRLGEYSENAALNHTIDTEATSILKKPLEEGNMDFTDVSRYDDYLGNDVLGAISTVKLGDQNVGLIIEVDSGEAYAGVNTLGTIMISVVVVVIILAFVLVLIMTGSIVKPLAAITEQSNKLARYDLSNDINDKYLNRKDEIGKIAVSIQSVMINLRSLLSSVSDTSQQVAASSEELTATAEQASMAAEEVANTVNEIATGASDQAESTNIGSIQVNDLGAVIEEDKLNIESMNQATSKVGELVREGLVLVEDLSAKTENNSKASRIAYESIIKTNDSSEKIGQASALIASIAEQTNLLALNAAIEAARAGEHGRGFSVVAEEIRKLAEQSTASTKSIDAIIQELKSDAHVAVEKMDETAKLVEAQGQSVSETESKFNEISNAMKDAERAVEILLQASLILEEKKSNVQAVIQNLSAVAQQNAASTEEVSATMEEQTASMNEIAQSSEGLSGLSQELSELIAKFKL